MLEAFPLGAVADVSFAKLTVSLERKVYEAWISKLIKIKKRNGVEFSFKLKASVCSLLKLRFQMPSNSGLHHNVVFHGPLPSHCRTRKIPVVAIAVD